MKVRIIKSEAWHTGMIGREFNVRQQGQYGWVEINEPGTAYHNNGLCAEDYVIVPAAPAQPANKIVKHNGIEYEVPGYTTYITRDNARRQVWAWEFKPTWNVESEAYYNAVNGVGKHTIVAPYVRQMPEGSFISAV